MAETVTIAEWQYLARLEESALRQLVLQQLAITDQAVRAVPEAVAVAQLVWEARRDLTQGDIAGAGDKRARYNAAFSKARWALDELRAPLGAAGQGALFEQLATATADLVPVPKPQPAPAPKPADKQPAPAPKPVDRAPSTTQARRELEELVKRGGPTLRAQAIAQRDAIVKKLTAARGFLGEIFGRWAVWDKAVATINDFIAAGDALPDGDPRKATRYAGALIEAQGVAQRLDKDIAEGGSATLLFKGAVEASETALTKAAETAKETALETGRTLRTGTLLLFGGLAVGLGVVVISRWGGKPARTERDYLFPG